MLPQVLPLAGSSGGVMDEERAVLRGLDRRRGQVPQIRFKLERRNGLAEQKALKLVAGMLAQEVILVLGLHAFRDDGQSKLAAHFDDGSGDRAVFDAAGEVARFAHAVNARTAPAPARMSRVPDIFDMLSPRV